jgi:aminoglycoside phosphotransferase (APT) family kinase protein
VDVVGGAELVESATVRTGSTTVHRLRITDREGRDRTVVLRRFIDRERLARDPWYVPRHEVAALEALGPTPVPAPRLLAADVAAEVCDVPTLLTTRVPGRPRDRPGARFDDGSLAQLVAPLVAIHAVGTDAVERAYEPYEPLDAIRVPSWSADPRVWEGVLELLDRPPPDGEDRFIHRDYHPGNTLWAGGSLAGVIDWTTACVGPPAIDLARMRQNLVLVDGVAAADRFLDRYVGETGRDGDRDPWWDLRDAADLLVDLAPPATRTQADRVRRWERYVARVAAEL